MGRVHHRVHPPQQQPVQRQGPALFLVGELGVGGRVELRLLGEEFSMVDFGALGPVLYYEGGEKNLIFHEHFGLLHDCTVYNLCILSLVIFVVLGELN